MDSAGTPSRVIVVDDDADYRELLALHLDAVDISVVAEAIDGREGLAAVAEHDPDLVVTDLQMPETSGLWLAERLQEQHPDLPIVMVTASASVNGIVAQAYAAGVTVIVDKTTGPAPVVAAVQAQLAAAR